MPRVNPSSAQRATLRLHGALQSSSNPSTSDQLDLAEHPNVVAILRIRDLCLAATCGIGSYLAIESLLQDARGSQNHAEIDNCGKDMRAQSSMVSRTILQLRGTRDQVLQDVESDETYSVYKPYRALLRAAFHLPMITDLPDPANAHLDLFKTVVLDLWDKYERALDLWQGNEAEDQVGWKEI